MGQASPGGGREELVIGAEKDYERGETPPRCVN